MKSPNAASKLFFRYMPGLFPFGGAPQPPGVCVLNCPQSGGGGQSCLQYLKPDWYCALPNCISNSSTPPHNCIPPCASVVVTSNPNQIHPSASNWLAGKVMVTDDVLPAA